MKPDDVSQEAETPDIASLKLAIRWAIQDVDDMFAMNMDEMEENEMVARIAHAVHPAIMAAKTEEREECAKIIEWRIKNHRWPERHAIAIRSRT